MNRQATSTGMAIVTFSPGWTTAAPISCGSSGPVRSAGRFMRHCCWRTAVPHRLSIQPTGTILDRPLYSPSRSYRQKANASEELRPRRSRLLQYVGHIQDSGLGEDPQVEIAFAGGAIGIGYQLKYVHRVSGQRIRKAITSRVLVCIADGSADGKCSISLCHSFAKNTENTALIIGEAIFNGHPKVLGYFWYQIAPICRDPFPKPIPNMPGSHGGIDGPEGPKLGLAVEQTGSFELLYLECQFGNQIPPRFQVERLPTVGNRGNWGSHEQSFGHFVDRMLRRFTIQTEVAAA